MACVFRSLDKRTENATVLVAEPNFEVFVGLTGHYSHPIGQFTPANINRNKIYVTRLRQRKLEMNSAVGQLLQWLCWLSLCSTIYILVYSICKHRRSS